MTFVTAFPARKRARPSLKTVSASPQFIYPLTFHLVGKYRTQGGCGHYYVVDFADLKCHGRARSLRTRCEKLGHGRVRISPAYSVCVLLSPDVEGSMPGWYYCDGPMKRAIASCGNRFRVGQRAERCCAKRPHSTTPIANIENRCCVKKQSKYVCVS